MTCCPSGRWWYRSAPRSSSPLGPAAELAVEPVAEVPHVSPRLLGWLKLLYRKALADDDWSRSGPPDPRGDGYSTVPMTSWPRFDLIDSAYVIALLADLTPAWCELHGLKDAVEVRLRDATTATEMCPPELNPEGTWVACGDRLFAALGMDYAQPRQVRAALKRACVTIRRVDARYAAGVLELAQLGRSWRIQAERPTWEVWRELRDEHAAVREAIARSRAV